MVLIPTPRGDLGVCYSDKTAMPLFAELLLKGFASFHLAKRPEGDLNLSKYFRL